MMNVLTYDYLIYIYTGCPVKNTRFSVCTIQTVITFFKYIYFHISFMNIDLYIIWDVLQKKIVLIFEHWVSILEHRPNDQTI